ncbi:hypothetical protein BRC86_07440 [Halobacteriales archaeon QS_3_64_16]|nr:MAG: hypothetical protein BRC86_07440 [Halobacteriales archaeon QS_3_64_16]
MPPAERSAVGERYAMDIKRRMSAVTGCRTRDQRVGNELSGQRKDGVGQSEQDRSHDHVTVIVGTNYNHR